MTGGRINGSQEHGLFPVAQVADALAVSAPEE
jgi:hypothetical protein